MMCPFKLKQTVLVDMKKILPVVEYEDFYEKVLQKGELTKTGKKDITRRTLPKIDSLMEWESVFGWAFVETYAFF